MIATTHYISSRIEHEANSAGQLLFSATDLANHLGCTHATVLDRQRFDGEIEAVYRSDPMLELLIELGDRHEAAYLSHLKQQGLKVVELDEDDRSNSKQAIQAMKDGVDVIAQACFVSPPWHGRCDFLLKVEQPGILGDWSYEVSDTKLSQTTKATAVLQLCLYSELLAEIQGVAPKRMLIVKPCNDESGNFQVDPLRLADYMAYYRMAKARFSKAVGSASPKDSYPDPCEHCNICKWWSHCNQVWRDDDHLSFIAGVTKSQRLEIVDQGIKTLTGFADAEKPLGKYPARGAMESYNKVHRQAKIQVKGIRSGKPEYVFNETEKDRGFLSLPEPDDGDIFFDIEGNPRSGHGLEYLFGFVTTDQGKVTYQGKWAATAKEEKRCFEQFIDFVHERWKKFPAMHIYHFAPYEPSAMKRLSLRHATREFELDDLLRAELFVDLYGITKQAIRASVESYSIKQLEQFYKSERQEDLKNASAALRAVERLIELDMTNEISDTQRNIVERYNEDDCLSTLELRNWVEQLRTELSNTGVELPRPSLGDATAKDSVKAMADEAQRVFDLLTFDIDESPDGDDQHARWLLAHALEYFRREAKCNWWEFFRLRDLEHEQLLQENLAVSGLEFISEIPGKRLPVHCYHYPEQETTLDEGHSLWDVEGNPVGSVDHIDLGERVIGIKKRKDTLDFHPNSVFEFTHIGPGSMPESLFSLGEQLHAAAKDRQPLTSARYQLLCRRPPRLKTLHLPLEGEFVDVAVETAADLDNSFLAIQGPPGTGKTYIGGQMIHALALSGKRVGVCAVSHAVIINLLSIVQEVNASSKTHVRLTHKTTHDLPDYVGRLAKNENALKALNEEAVVGGTAWLWSNSSMEQQLDYLFIDEAGQMSLAMALAAGRAAKNIVLLGDPQQLEQPQQALHPEGSGIAALAHVLQGKDTIPDDEGLFLSETWRLHPLICEFTSEQYYDGRLQSLRGLEIQEVFGTDLSGHGLRYVPVEHVGNLNRSFEEVNAIKRLTEQLIDNKHEWANRESSLAAITWNEILIVAPYNAQVSAFKAALPAAARVGTVDKFQGQEAPIVIYSMTSSSADVAPRGLSFLFNRNRMNVATSRARCIVLLVGSPALFEAQCSTPEQMQLANGVCRYLELTSSETEIESSAFAHLRGPVTMRKQRNESKLK